MLHTTGFVLRRNDYREYDRIYTVYTSDFGKMSLLVRGAKRIKSKLAPALENFEKVRIDFAKGKVFNHLSGSSAQAENKEILKDAKKISLAADCLRLVDRFIKPEEEDARIFNLISDTLSAIAGNFFFSLGTQKGELEEGFCPPPGLPLTIEGGKYLQKIKIYFFWKLIEYLGYEPRLDECALCGNIIVGKSAFNITENILICNKCTGEGVQIGEDTLVFMRSLFSGSLSEFSILEINKELYAITEKAKQIKLSEL